MSNQIENRLVDYLDNRLSEQEAREVETLIESDNEVRQHWEYLQLAVQAVEHTALQKQVAQVKEQYKASHNNGATPSIAFRSRKIYRWVAGVAAIFLVAACIKYITTNADDLYRQGYTTYALNTSRSGGAVNDMELAFRGKNWQGVIDAFNRSAQKDTKSWFLSAMAHMELQQYKQAAWQFGRVMEKNARSGDDYFQDETEYYLALSWLAIHRNKDAISMIEKIKTEPNHLYHAQAGRISGIDLKIVSIKAGK